MHTLTRVSKVKAYRIGGSPEAFKMCIYTSIENYCNGMPFKNQLIKWLFFACLLACLHTHRYTHATTVITNRTETKHNKSPLNRVHLINPVNGAWRLVQSKLLRAAMCVLRSNFFKNNKQTTKHSSHQNDISLNG